MNGFDAERHVERSETSLYPLTDSPPMNRGQNDDSFMSCLYPKSAARFYDIVYDKLRSPADLDFYLRRISKVKGKILEIGCGTGRIFCEALKHGADIYGMDLENEMLSVLKRKIPKTEHYRVAKGNIIKQKPKGRFDLIVVPFRVFSHFYKTDEQISALKNISSALNKKGEFIFDVFNPDFKLFAEHSHAPRMDFEGEWRKGDYLRRIVYSRPDYVNQVAHLDIQWQWCENGKDKTANWKCTMRYYFRYELENLIALSGLKVKKIYGAFDESPLRDDSKELIFVCSVRSPSDGRC